MEKRKCRLNDIEYTKAISSAVTLPAGGKTGHFYKGVVKGGTQTLLSASMFHTRTICIQEVKEYLREKG